MKPSMRQNITANVPVLDANGEQIKDKYDRPQTEEVHSKARVQFKSQLVHDAMGREHEVNLEIDIPRNFNPDVGTTVDYVTVAGDKGGGTIKAKSEVLNLAGNKVFYRTVFVDG